MDDPSDYIPTDAEGGDDWTHQVLVSSGVPEEAADIGGLLISASPIGSVADMAQGLDRFVDALEDGDIEGAEGHLGEAGLNAAVLSRQASPPPPAIGPFGRR